ncbi:DNA primase [Kocuria flava]|uniref:DNA primase n=1 Tax=Kocuria flava TaxID=446860 RepID=A0ABQ0XAH6_9MICC|nr:DNA primase [Kocuria flava]
MPRPRCTSGARAGASARTPTLNPVAGLIRREDIDEVRSRTDIKEIVDGYVTLKSAGIGSWKGLCPFHDERTPSFHVRPQMGTYHCFGCDESGDVIAFLMNIDHTTFTETVEKLAARIGYELHYEQGSGPKREEVGRRQRLLDAHKVAAEYFQRNLYTRQAGPAQQFLGERGFDGDAARRYGVGYAPRGWDHLLKHLRGRGFTDQELKLTGMFSEGNRGLYDRFRGRLVWPIRAVAGEVIGFGARKLFDDDQGPKYLNTPETPLYKKSQVLYGIDLAKREIAKQRRVVVVEGYTDVMACHLAGVPTAVATCGTAFGPEHIKIVRRFLSDSGGGGEVVFTFDGDAAGQKAALRAFEEDQKFVAQTYVAVEPHGMDPCDLRLARGDAAVVELVGTRRPLFEFAIRATLKNFDLDTIEGRIRAMRACAPIVARIRDRSLRPAYARQLAGWLGLDPSEVQRAVDAAGRAPREDRAPARAPEAEPAAEPGGQLPDPREPVARMEREALETVIQCAHLLQDRHWEEFGLSVFRYPVHGAVHDAVLAARSGLPAGTAPAGQPWVDAVRGHLPEPLHGYLAELAVTPLPATTESQLERYTADILNRLFELQINRRKSDRLAELQRTDPTAQRERYQQLQRELLELEMQRRSLRPD